MRNGKSRHETNWEPLSYSILKLHDTGVFYEPFLMNQSKSHLPLTDLEVTTLYVRHHNNKTCLHASQQYIILHIPQGHVRNVL